MCVCVCARGQSLSHPALLKSKSLDFIYSNKMKFREAFLQPHRKQWCQQDIKILLLSFLRLSDVRHLL